MAKAMSALCPQVDIGAIRQPAVETPCELSASAKGVILPGVAEAIYGASASQFSQAPVDEQL
jgi:hypothetical protein